MTCNMFQIIAKQDNETFRVTYFDEGGIEISQRLFVNGVYGWFVPLKREININRIIDKVVNRLLSEQSERYVASK